ncbi:hypothetical protein [Streptomyces kanasensis]|uniref:hypothetical protein n=1 Tax=Streptomyces kanasensis TaxID=936756 RepID=UPI0036F5C141
MASAAVPADEPAVRDFRPTHVVPRHGMATWESPDTARPTVPLDPFLPVRLLERTGDWARVLCANGWAAWVDGRLLVSVPEDPPAAARDTARAADPRPLLTRAEESLGRYRRAVEDLAAGRSDGERFRRNTGGLRIGVVVDGEAMWLYDAGHERWLYCDGYRLAEYAGAAAPSLTPSVARPANPPVTPPPGVPVVGAAPGPGTGHEPTRVVTTGPAAPGAAPEPTQVVPLPEGPGGTGGPVRITGPGAPADPDGPHGPGHTTGSDGTDGSGRADGAYGPGPDAQARRAPDSADGSADPSAARPTRAVARPPGPAPGDGGGDTGGGRGGGTADGGRAGTDRDAPAGDG